MEVVLRVAKLLAPNSVLFKLADEFYGIKILVRIESKLSHYKYKPKVIVYWYCYCFDV